MNYFTNGHIYEKSNYVNGYINGLNKQFHDNGLLAMASNYVDGKNTEKNYIFMTMDKYSKKIIMLMVYHMDYLNHCIRMVKCVKNVIL